MSSCGHRDENYACLAHVPIFAGLSDAEKEEIARISASRSYKKGETVYRAGDAGGTLFVLHAGRVKVFRLSAAGKEQVLRVAGPGEFIGELSLFSSLPLTDHAQATESTVLCVLEGGRMKELMAKYPVIAFKVMDVLSRRLEKADSLLESVALTPVAQRVAKALLERADAAGEVRLPMARVDFASQLGMSQETLSRRLTAMQEEGLVALSGRRKIILKDRAAVEALRDAEE